MSAGRTLAPGGRRPSRAALAGLVAAVVAAPALAYVLPPAAVLKRAAERRAALGLAALEVTGTLELRGPAAARVPSLAGAAGVAVSAPARLLLKVPGRVRLEAQPAGAAEGEEPALWLRGEALSGRGGLPETAAAAALARGLAALLAPPGDAEGQGLGEALARRGVRLDEAALGRASGRIAVVLGGRPTEPRPLAFLDKETFAPLRLVFAEGGALHDVRLVDWGGPTGGDWFPRVVEVWQGPALLLRFTTARATANPALPDALFDR